MGLYHIILFFFRRGSKEYLYFGLFCILMGIRQLHNENHTFYPNLIIKRTLNKSSTIGSSRRSRIRF
ncbi:7TM-DISM domain-containing protein [Leptospira sp. FAT2]|nr:7TM-DISM domain-containing protein [Leptospira sanjuanensis]